MSTTYLDHLPVSDENISTFRGLVIFPPRGQRPMRRNNTEFYHYEYDNHVAAGVAPEFSPRWWD
ncbi:hypothetical protein Leryth_001870 [Lithospermum erythrorhizon]|nr:hypothetical protein Leryth_001870 [Lithospermum erythrorhizon]